MKACLFCLLGSMAVLSVFNGCGEPQPTQLIRPEHFAPFTGDPFRPEAKADGWAVSTLEEQGLNPAFFEALSFHIREGAYKDVRSILVVRNGFLVFEDYYQDYGPGSLQILRSATKSVGSLLIGIAIDKGFLSGVDQTMPEILPTQIARIDALDPNKLNIQLQDILTMTIGLDWDESPPFEDPQNTLRQMSGANDWVKFVLERPVKYNPGSIFTYNTGNSVLMGAILKDVTGLHAHQFAEQHLFSSLEIAEYDWIRQADGLAHTGGGLYLTPRDFAKIGQLVCSGGVWKGNRVVSEAWIGESTKPWVNDLGDEFANQFNYGYQWWLATPPVDRPDPYPESFPDDVVFASGDGGQFVFAVRSLNLVVAFTGGNFGQPETWAPLFILYDFILRSVVK